MTRILHILPRTPTGGVGAFLKNTQDHLSGRYVFDYLIIEDVANSNFIPYVEARGSKVILLNICLSLRNSLKIRNEFKKKLTENRYSIVHLHSANIATLIFPVCKELGINVRIVHSHSTQYSDVLLKSIRNCIIEKPMFFFATHLIACSGAAGDFLFKKRPYTVLYNGIDTERFHPEKNHTEGKKEMIIGHVGNFLPCKNHEFLIQVFEELCKKCDNYKLYLFGDGILREKIEHLVHEKGLSNKVVFWGRINNIQDYYDDIDLFVLPSLYEGFPVAVMEAQAYGIPIIASDSITREIDFFGDTKFVDISDKSISKWVLEIENVDYSSRNKKSLEFKKSIFTIQETTKQLEHFYDKCLIDE